MSQVQSGDPPYALAMLICDTVWVDPTTSKKFILGVFSNIFAREFPAVHPHMAVYISFTDASGNIPVKLQLVDAEEAEEPIFKYESEIHSPDRAVMHEWCVGMVNVTFPSAGEYRLQAFAGDTFLIERRILIINPLESGHEQ